MNKLLFVALIACVFLLGCTEEPQVVKEIVVYNETNCPSISCPPAIQPTSIDVYFCPQDNCFQALIDVVSSANESVHVAIYSFTRQDLADAIITKNNASLDVFVVMDKSQAAGVYSIDEYLVDNRVNVTIKSGSNGGIMHNKIVVVDGKVVCTGSVNYSIGGFEKNDENLICIFSESIAKQYENYLETLI